MDVDAVAVVAIAEARDEKSASRHCPNSWTESNSDWTNANGDPVEKCPIERLALSHDGGSVHSDVGLGVNDNFRVVRRPSEPFYPTSAYSTTGESTWCSTVGTAKLPRDPC